MTVAVLASFEDGVITGAGRRTEWALITRGLADEIRGNVTYYNRHGNPTRTFTNVYSGARLNAEGLRVRADLRAAQNT